MNAPLRLTVWARMMVPDETTTATENIMLTLAAIFIITTFILLLAPEFDSSHSR